MRLPIVSAVFALGALSLAPTALAQNVSPDRFPMMVYDCTSGADTFTVGLGLEQGRLSWRMKESAQQEWGRNLCDDGGCSRISPTRTQATDSGRRRSTTYDFDLNLGTNVATTVIELYDDMGYPVLDEDSNIALRFVEETYSCMQTA